MLVAHSGHGLDGPKLLALRAARRPEISAELREALRRQRLEGRQLTGDYPDEGVHSLHRCQRSQRVTGLEQRNESGQLMENQLEPELACLVHDDEQQLVRMLGRGTGTLQAEQLFQRQVGRVIELCVRVARL
jgi:hypothetical protein